MLSNNGHHKMWVYLGARTCELFLCFVAIVGVRVIMLTSLFSLFYVTHEFHRFLHRGRALILEIKNNFFQSHYITRTAPCVVRSTKLSPVFSGFVPGWVTNTLCGNTLPRVVIPSFLFIPFRRR